MNILDALVLIGRQADNPTEPLFAFEHLTSKRGGGEYCICTLPVLVMPAREVPPMVCRRAVDAAHLIVFFLQLSQQPTARATSDFHSDDNIQKNYQPNQVELNTESLHTIGASVVVIYNGCNTFINKTFGRL